jgi:hypothetical protein
LITPLVSSIFSSLQWFCLWPNLLYDFWLTICYF